MGQKDNNQKPIWKDIRFYFVGIFAIVTIAFLIQLMILQVVPMKYFIPLVVVLGLLGVGLWFLQYGKRISKGNQILGKVVIVILTVLLSVGNIYVFTTNDTIGKIAGENIETNAISVIVLKDSEYKDIKDLKEAKFGAFETIDKENIEATKQDLNTVLDTTIQYETYSSCSAEAEALYNGNIDAIIVNEAYRGLFEEKHPNFDEETRVIYQHKIEKQLTDISKDVDVTNTPFNVYISGIDTAGPVSTRSRSDVNIIASVNPNTRKIVLTSIPRDYYVPQTCQAGQEDKLTHTGVFGVECTVNTAEEFFGIDINYYARVNFTSLINIVDALGGISVDNPNNFNAGGYSFPAGTVELDGKKALAFSRERYSFSSGDSERGKNQMRVMTGMINKAISPSIITNYTSVMNAVSGSFQTNMVSKDITSLIKMQLGDMKGWSIIQQQVSGTGQNGIWSPANYTYSYMLFPDMDSVSEAVAVIKENMK